MRGYDLTCRRSDAYAVCILYRVHVGAVFSEEMFAIRTAIVRSAARTLASTTPITASRASCIPLTAVAAPTKLWNLGRLNHVAIAVYTSHLTTLMVVAVHTLHYFGVMVVAVHTSLLM